ncbi:GNAT family N-acetyltransferase [Roseomonas alkaliterrae]|uniref:GNAT superfamily N-acetyltransferase n=1 Tax=Neoroseomonas alkaliterrae TaxID=1452450 RepID=A0A840XLU7_9PROT|nr:GNAT superfamily N-acetyltransferase [Neoroseomonas alkaliterrae]MBR0677209.1 GNAT family N-acetyltransferase [Neoroseomonas alkaliterrae]
MSPPQIRTMRREELDLALDWAAEEGWNPGLADAGCFHAADPGGFLVAERDGERLGCVSAVHHGAGFGFLGFYIVRPPFRGQGIGLALWRAAMARLAGRVVGLDGVVAQQENYRRSGFALVHRNIRYGAEAPAAPGRAGLPAVVAASDVPFAAIAACDRAVFPAEREAFLRAWLAAPGHVARAVPGADGLRGFAVLRPCRSGSKIGPLVAADPAAARALLAALLDAAPAGPVFLDLPEPNPDALAMAREAGMQPVFETARMYAGGVPDLPLARIYGITSFELG